MNINPYVFSWAICGGRQSLLHLPSDATDPYLVDYSQLLPDGDTLTWIWIFEHPEDAVSVRILSRVVTGDIWPCIEAALCRSDVYVQKIPLDWLKTVDLGAIGIDQVWLNFDRKRFYRRARLDAVVERLPAAEFLRRC